MQRPCTLVRVETHFEHESEANNGSRERIYNGSRSDGNRKLHETEEFLRCELEEEDRVKVGKYFVPVHGIERDQFDNIVSGDTTLIAEDAMIVDGEMYVPSDAAIEYGSNGQNNRRLQASRNQGIKKVLVVRANGQGSSTTASRDTLSDKIFGTNGDNHTLKSQYLDCSHGKLLFQPYTGMTRAGTYIDNGVIDVTINTYVPGTSRYDVEDAIERAADQLVGRLQDQFDHVMLCLPPGSASGSNRNWIAYGYVNSWLTVFNDDFCESMTTQVHEIGHNLGLAHSGKDGISYGDKTGMMGYSYNRDNGPLQCFNPAKTYQLGWLNDKAVEVDPNAGRWEGTVIGTADYSNPTVDPNANVIVKVEDLYIGYNRKKGMNAGVNAAGDAVIIVEQGPGYTDSDFLATLTVYDPIKIFNNFRGTDKNLVVELTGRRSQFDEVIVAVYYDTDFHLPDQIQQLPTNVPTFKPTQTPTNRPTFPEPTASPTSPKPTPAPTRERMHNINYNSPQSTRPATPRELLSENFLSGLGVFNGEGNSVTRDVYEYVLTAKFEMNEVENLPSIYTDFDLFGTSIIQVSFWYNAESIQYGEGFKLQYSTDHGNSWIDIRTYQFGENGFDSINTWNFARSETYQVEQGVSTTKLRIVGETTTNNSNAIFHIAGVTVYGV